jgi:hypothetical protein
MIVATALCGVLLLGLWTLYSTYANLFDRGQARVERSQLCRALMQQIADDVQSAIQDPVPGAPDRVSGTAQRRRFGFAGSSSELRMDVLQITPRQGNRVPVGDAALPSAESTEARVPELRTVYYTFAALESSSDDEAVPAAPGLIRRELDFETPASEREKTADISDAGNAIGVDADLSHNDRASELDSPTRGTAAIDDRLTWVPEVVSLEFRYFDGASWSSSWNSLLRNALPVAVEVRIALADPHSSVPPPVVTEASDEEVEPLPQVTQAVTHVHLIVDLPASAEYRKPRPAETSARRVVPNAARRIVPRRWTSPEQPRQLPEDWLRTSKP